MKQFSFDSNTEFALQIEEEQVYPSSKESTNFEEGSPIQTPTGFLVAPGGGSVPTIPPACSSLLTPPASPSSREPVRILVVGTAYGIDNIVHTLYAKGFAHISEWSGLLPHSSGKLMRILTRYVQKSAE
jgi:hypothetical protein